ncbi:MAG: hypothetical protein HY720_08760 [Planctomycetes bacterium]|nr:hypothetical protein [Planctomycetota bacterium]
MTDLDAGRESPLPPFLRNRRALEEEERQDLLKEAAALRRLTPAQRARMFFELLEFEDRLLAARPRDLERVLASERAQKLQSYFRLRRGVTERPLS